LRQICHRILCDEQQHLEYLAGNMTHSIQGRGEFCRALTLLIHWLALSSASLVVFALHQKLFRAAGISLLRFCSMAFAAHKPIFFRSTQPERISVREPSWML